MRREHGFSLIELMVGVGLGLLATVIIAQVFLQSEGSKRTTTSGSDAQVTGAMALFFLQRDIQMAGYGLASMPSAIGCPLTATKGTTKVMDPVARPTTDLLVPVVIGPGGSAAVSDTITIFSSGNGGYSVPAKLTLTHAKTDTTFTVQSTLGILANDLLVAAPIDWQSGDGCTLIQATSASPTSTTAIVHANSAEWNVSNSTDMPNAGYVAGSVLSSALLNLGPAPIRRQYSVNTTNWNLQVTNSLSGAGTRDLFPQVVLLKALYGKASASAPNGPVTVYETAAPTTNAGWRLVKAIRLALVVRSAQYEKDSFTTAGPVWDMGSAASVSGMENCAHNANSRCLKLDVSGVGSDRQRYRYKVFDTVIPLRNVVWNP